jgi:hypothetical protein
VRKHFTRRQVSTGLIATTAATLSPTGASGGAPDYVDLGPNQTLPIRDQGARRSCITFGALAALEAALNRAGYGRLDLSEQFLNHVGKMTWLHPRWDDVVAAGEDGGESQVGAFSGGNGADYIKQLSRGMKVPVESELPYVGRDFDATDHPYLATRWCNFEVPTSAYCEFWRQRRINDFNLDERFLPRSALLRGPFYSVKSSATVGATDVSAIENALASNREVVWDFWVANTGQDAIIWQACPSPGDCGRGSHCMLLIGYDRRDADPSKHYFLAKNSYGPTAHPDGFTRISYDYVRRHGITAAYITEVERPERWPQASFLDRWNLNYDGWRGVLDVYHIPGIAQWRLDGETVRILDGRIGSFYDHTGKAFRVNGRMVGPTIDFYIDPRNANARWDQLGGRKFEYVVAGDLMAGYHTDPDGRTYGGFATNATTFPAGARTPRPLGARSYIGDWHADFLIPMFAGSPPSSGPLHLTSVDNSFLSPTERANFDGLSGLFYERVEGGTGRFEVRALVDKRQPTKIVLRLVRVAPAPRFGSFADRFEITAYHLNHADGIVAGKGQTSTYIAGLVMVRQ